MRLVFLGTTGYHPTERRQTASLIIPELGLVLDAGTGLFRLADHLATEQLDICLSHAHLDHVIGLTYLVESMGVDASDRITVHATAKTLRAVREHLFAEPLFPVAPPFQFAEYRAGQTIGGARLTTFPLVHPGGSTGMRFDWPDRSLAYVTDTTASLDADYIDQIRGVDLLVHEANFPAGHDAMADLTGHSCLNQVVAVARAAAVKRLVLVHCDALLARHEDFDLTEARRVFADTSWAADGDEIDF